MASPCVVTPIKSHKGLFSSRTAGGRMPLTPSPSHRATSNNGPLRMNSSPFTPERQSNNDYRASPKSTYTGGLMAHLNRSRNSPKSSIARSSQAPRKALELGVSNFTLVGTGNVKPPTKKITATKPSKTTVSYSSDRYIPNRLASNAFRQPGCGKPDESQRLKNSNPKNCSVLSSAVDDAMAAFESLNLDVDSNDNDDEPEVPSRPSPTTKAYQDSLAEACDVDRKTRILEFKPPAPESFKAADPRLLYNRPLKPAVSSQTRRKIAKAPVRVLDAPGLPDDYYLNLLDWSSSNQVAIGLERSVYVWSADEGSVSCLLETSPDTYVSSVKWSGDGAYVGVGLGTGEVQIWDVAEGQKIRSMFGHDSRVGVMGWSKHLLSTGARSGLVFNHDVRIAEHKVAELVSHTSEVCGLEWRSDGAQLATGGNDNLVSIWDARSLSVPKFTKTNHKAAVKALAWCPWNMNLLATGGGSYDRNIHFWNATSGARVNSIDTGSQVTSLRWSPHSREIVSTSGFPDNSLSIWSYPSLVRTIEIPAHESRVLHSCLSPDGQVLATVAADESMKFWEIFEKKAPRTNISGSKIQGATIR